MYKGVSIQRMYNGECIVENGDGEGILENGEPMRRRCNGGCILKSKNWRVCEGECFMESIYWRVYTRWIRESAYWYYSTV